MAFRLDALPRRPPLSPPFALNIAADEPAKRSTDPALNFVLPRSVLRLVFASQILIVVTLLSIVVSFLFVAYRMSSTTNAYWNAMSSYVEAAADHGMSILAHSDEASAQLEHAMHEADRVATESGPQILSALNNTQAMTSRAIAMLRNPTVKLSLT
jgi:hypothetical protein